MSMPPAPIWRVILGQNDGMITYNAAWLQNCAIDWHFYIDRQKVRLEYLSIEAMPFRQSASVEFGYEGKIYKGIVYEVTE